jgi:glycosyltransferase involved in cell wall biosynthesis
MWRVRLFINLLRSGNFQHASIKLLNFLKWNLLLRFSLPKLVNKISIFKNPKSRIESKYFTNGIDVVNFNHALTVVVPHVNYGRYLEESLNAIKKSTLGNFRVIVIESGSDPENLALVKEIDRVNSDSRISFIYDERHRLGYNRNLGASKALSPFIANFDPDDLVNPNYFEVALFVLVARGLDVVGSKVEVFGQETGIWNVPPIVRLEDLNTRNCIPSHAVFRKATWETVGGFVDTVEGDFIHEDWRFWHRVSAQGGRIRNIQTPLISIRIHGSNMSRGKELLPEHEQARSIRRLNSDSSLSLNRLLPAKLRDFANPSIDKLSIQNLAKLNRDITFKGSRVLVFLPWLDQSGATKVLTTIMEELKQRGIDFIICLTEPHPESASKLEVDAEIWDLPLLLEKDLWQNFVDYLITSKGITHFWQMGSNWLYENLEGLNISNIEVIDSLFSPESNHMIQSILRSKFIDQIVVESEFMAAVYKKKGGSLPVNIGPNGIDVYNNHLNLSRTIDILYVGRMSPEKNPMDFLKLVQRIQILRPHIKLNSVMVGDGPLFESLKKYSSERALGVQFTGFEPNPRLYMSSAKVLVVTSTPVDGRPNVVLESLSCGTPVCSYAIGDIPKIITSGENGFIVDHGNLDQIAINVMQILESKNLLETLSSNAREAAFSNHTWEQAFDTYFNLMKNGSSG